VSVPYLEVGREEKRRGEERRGCGYKCEKTEVAGRISRWRER
jgi:hypothetical protein